MSTHTIEQLQARITNLRQALTEVNYYCGELDLSKLTKAEMRGALEEIGAIVVEYLTHDESPAESPPKSP